VRNDLARGDAVVLCVGQLLPHKRPDLAVDAHHLLNVNYDATARLVLCGPPRNPHYDKALHQHVDGLNLRTVWMTGEVDNSQLASFYRGADVLVLPSEHEGFGVPLVEAFHFGLPVIARDFGAVAETCGGAALLLPATSRAADLCEAVHRVLSDSLLRQHLISLGYQRAEQFSMRKTTAALVQALQRVLRRDRER